MRPSGLAIGLAALLGVSIGPIAVLLLAPVLCLGAVILDRFDWRPILVVIVIALLASIRGTMDEARTLSQNVPASHLVVASVVGLPVAGGDSERVTVEVESVGDGNGDWEDAAGRVVVFLPEDVAGVSMGDRLFLVWNVTDGKELDPGFRSFVRSQGAEGSAWAFQARVEDEGPAWIASLSNLRREIADALLVVLPGDAGALAAGIVTGDDSALSNPAAHGFRRTGTSHITAVSGQNVALLIGVLGATFRPRRKRMRIAAGLLTMVVIWSFVVMVGLEPPALRAAIVATLALGAATVGRRADALTLLSLTLGSMAVWNPAIVSGIGFWLSATASFALCSALPSRAVGLKDAMRAMVRGVFAANIATMPVILWGFGTWSPTSLLANVVIGPVMTLTFPATYAISLLALVSPTAAGFAAWIPGLGLDVTLATVDRLAALPGGLTLPAADPRVLLLLGLPCAAVVLALGRDASRWTALIQTQGNKGVTAMSALASGAVAGMLALFVLAVIAN